MRTHLLLATVLAITPMISAFADDDIMSGPSRSSSSSTVIVEDTKGVQFKFKERLSNIQEQVNRGLDNKWLSVGQAAAFKTERERLLDLTNQTESAGWPKDQVDRLEKDVTVLSAKVSSAATKGGPKAPAPQTEESGAPLK